eukprot:2575780-Rhodomonas_salina.3
MRATPTDEELGFETGGVLAWGINVHGRLGDGGWVDGFRPKRNKLAKDVVAVSAGDYHSLALCSNGLALLNLASSSACSLAGALKECVFSFGKNVEEEGLSLIHISEPTRPRLI